MVQVVPGVAALYRATPVSFPGAVAGHEHFFGCGKLLPTVLLSEGASSNIDRLETLFAELNGKRYFCESY